LNKIYEVIKVLSSEFALTRCCEALEVSSSAYYAWSKGQTYILKGDKKVISDLITGIFGFHKRRYGARRIREELKDRGHEIGRFQIRNRMKEQNLKAIQPKSFVPKTTKSDPNLRRSPNLLLIEENLPTAPNQVIVGDITYLPNQEPGYDKWLYLATWLDLFSHRIVGWHIDRHMEQSIVLTSMKQVIAKRAPEEGFIVHSDGGGQYGGHEFRKLLKFHGFRQSMTRKDNHYDNATAESLFSRFKAELLDGGTFYGLEDAYYKTFDFIEGYYNTLRKHSSIDYLSPIKFEERFWKKQ